MLPFPPPPYNVTNAKDEPMTRLDWLILGASLALATLCVIL